MKARLNYIVYSVGIICVVGILSCRKNPRSCFDVSAQEINVGESVDFFNCSENAKSFLWIFGDGDSLSSNNLQISHSYKSAGEYTVTLQSYNDQEGIYDVESAVVVVNASSDYFSGVYKVNEQYSIGDTNATKTSLTYFANTNRKNDTIFYISKVNAYINIEATVMDTLNFVIKPQVVHQITSGNDLTVREITGSGKRTLSTLSFDYTIQERFNGVIQSTIIGEWNGIIDHQE